MPELIIPLIIFVNGVGLVLWFHLRGKERQRHIDEWWRGERDFDDI